MANIKLQHVNTFADRHGRLRSYLRLPGRKALALPGQPGSPEFMAAYNAAITGAAPPPGASKVLPGSLDDLVVSWYASDHWTTLRGTTQAHYRRVIENLRKEHGNKPIRLMTPAGVRKLMEGRPATMANRVLRLIGLLLRHAIELGWRDDDPTRDVAQHKHKVVGFQTWSEAQIAQFRAHHKTGTVPRLALELLLNTGQRRGDVVLMGRQHLSSQAIRIRQSKTGQWVEVPIMAELAAELAQVPPGQMTFLEVHGAPRTPGGFYNSFSDWRAEAGLPAGLAPHGLRKACGVRLAEVGCTDHELMAVLGHRTIAQVQIYTKEANRKKMAQSAMAKFAQIGNTR